MRDTVDAACGVSSRTEKRRDAVFTLGFASALICVHPRFFSFSTPIDIDARGLGREEVKVEPFDRGRTSAHGRRLAPPADQRPVG